MKPSTLKAAILEAQRFIDAAEMCLENLHASERTVNFINGGKLSGCAKRASMDLTRKLADLRAGR